LKNQVLNPHSQRPGIFKNLVGTGLLLAVMLLAGASASHAQVSFGIRIGPPPQARVVRVRPRSPGADFVWLDGYWYPQGNRYKWHDGYWTRPPYQGARWIEPRHDGQQFYAGYWEGDRGRMDHDHRWDKSHDRDRDRYQDNGGDRNQGGERNQQDRR
jgi:hypothetical protein